MGLKWSYIFVFCWFAWSAIFHMNTKEEEKVKKVEETKSVTLTQPHVCSVSIDAIDMIGT